LLYYVPNFYAWTNSLIPQKFSEKALKFDDGRLIIPLINKEKKIFGYQGRAIKNSLDSKAQKYYTIILDESQPKIFGMDKVDVDRTAYVFEGPIDSMFIKNSMAVCGGDLWSASYWLKDAVYVFDNEPRHPDTLKKMKKTIKRGYKIVIWPSGIHEKDLNEMVLGGFLIEYLQSVIRKNTCKGLEAELRFGDWSKRCC
jgi:hypothetical protein